MPLQPAQIAPARSKDANLATPEDFPPSGSWGRPGNRRYLRGYLRSLRLLDTLVVGLVAVATHVLYASAQAGTEGGLVDTAGYASVTLAIVAGWLIALHAQDSYDGRFMGHGIQEYRQVFQASLWVFAVVAMVAFALNLDFARGYVVFAFPAGTALLLLGRWFARKWLVRQRRDLRLCDRVLLVGGREHVAGLVTALGRSREAGYNVLGACVDHAHGDHIGEIPIVGGESDVLVKALDLDVDVVAVSSSAGLGPTGLRRLAWALEGTEIDLVVAPGIMDVAGPRVLTRPVQGLPLLHLEAPTFTGPHLIVKSLIDRLGALICVLLLSPVLLAVAIAVKLEDRGPILFRQVRVGLRGDSFEIFKFRSMVLNAEAILPQLAEANESSGPLFKMEHDPRVTRVGRFIRRYSLDELPQLFNVIRGEMSLVGPRPPLPREVAAYEQDTHRRMLVKPGMTGLWQISGRSRLPWEEAVRLDLYYVENWTPVLDLMILWRTALVVLRPEVNGAS